MEREPEKEDYTGEKYDLDQLIYINHTVVNSLVVNINLKHADVYKLQNNSLTKIIDKDNEFTTEEGEYIEQHAPLQGEGTVYGTGASKVEKSILRMGQEFLNNLEEEIKESFTNKREIKYILIYHSKKLQEAVGDFKKEMENHFTKAAVKAVGKNIQNANKLAEESSGVIKKLQAEDLPQ